MDFIPAKESPFLIWFFDKYTRWLLHRRFKAVYVSQHYHPGTNSKTIYYLNHNSWWDGLIPLYLNRKYFHQQARAMMEDKQMVKYTFFKRLGAFSINLDEPRSSVSSLRYALKSVQNPGSALYIYPEGKLMNPSSQKPDFKAGLTWLYKKTSEVDFVPVAIFIDHSKGNKPELHIKIGSNVKPDKSMESKRLTTLFEESLQMLLTEVKDKERL